MSMRWCGFPVVLAILLLTVSQIRADGVLDARDFIAKGEAARAKAALQKYLARKGELPRKAEAEELLKHIGTIEIFIDHSHELRGPSYFMGHLLKANGYGLITNSAYIPTRTEDLAASELVILWQEGADIKYDNAEYVTLINYVKQGGRLLIITNPQVWMKDNKTRTVKRYPLWGFAKKFGLKLKKETEERRIGDGKVSHYRNSTYLVTSRTRSTDASVRRGLLTFIARYLPYEKLADSEKSRQIRPELSFESGPTTVYYAKPLAKRAEFAKKAIPKVLENFRTIFKGNVAENIIIRTTAEAHAEPGGKGFEFIVSLGGSRNKFVHHLAIQFYQAWLTPEEDSITLPYWVNRPWADMVAVDLLKKLKLGDEYANIEKSRRGSFLRSDSNKNRIDISVPPSPRDFAAVGKCHYVFRELNRKYGYALLAKFREMLFLYYAAGKLPKNLTTADTIHLLSQAAKQNLFPFFRSIGTNVTPVPIDFAEPQRLRRAAAAREKKEAAGE